ncbi:MAG: AAA family ATPase [Promethearchaeota archaeon]
MIYKNFIIILVGLPASGKSSYAKELKKALNKEFSPFKAKIIDPDKIRESLITNKFDHKKEQLIRKNYFNSVEKAIKEGYIVICDDLNYYTSMRHDLKKIAENFKINFFIIHISTPFEICLKWNEKRGEPIPNYVIKNIKDKFDSFNRYNWDKPIETFDLSKIQDIKEVVKKTIDNIEKKLGFESKKKEEIIKRQSNLNNEKLDIITRKIVGRLLKKPEFFFLQKQIIKQRKSFIKQNLNKSLEDLQIKKLFKEFLEKNLNVKIS